MMQTATPCQVGRSEKLARSLVIVLLLGVASVIFVNSNISKPNSDGGVIEIRARMPEQGGWSPADIRAQVGEPLQLHLTSDDVMHGFAIAGGQFLDNPISVDVEPGKVTELNLTFDQAGKYTYYCTRWCGVNHWRMRGTIEVSGSESPARDLSTPLYLSLGLDIDAPHPAAITPRITPSAARGALLEVTLPKNYSNQAYYHTRSPAEIWQALRNEPALKERTDMDIWDLVAFVWWSNTTPKAIQEGQQLYAANCAACHGETGTGDGVMADQLASNQSFPTSEDHAFGHTTTKPTNFTKAADMLGASPALLQGKILRGGMGTGMPYWGPIFTDSQTWAIVDYLWTFQFRMELNP